MERTGSKCLMVGRKKTRTCIYYQSRLHPIVDHLDIGIDAFCYKVARERRKDFLDSNAFKSFRSNTIYCMFQIYHKITITSIMIQTAFPNNPHLYLLIVQNQTSVIKKQFNFIAKKFYSSFLLFLDQL